MPLHHGGKRAQLPGAGACATRENNISWLESTEGKARTAERDMYMAGGPGQEDSDGPVSDERVVTADVCRALAVPVARALCVFARFIAAWWR